jgi:hypothetical protein
MRLTISADNFAFLLPFLNVAADESYIKSIQTPTPPILYQCCYPIINAIQLNILLATTSARLHLSPVLVKLVDERMHDL